MTRAKSLACLLLVVTCAVFSAGCWIILPEETAVVVEVYDSEGRPVNDVAVNVDGGVYVTGDTTGNEGRVFRSLSTAGNHTVSILPASLVDPQGGRRYAPLASLVSGETAPLSYGSRPFAGLNDAILVPVAKGFISVVTIYLADVLAAPADNQWLTDGNLASDWREPYNGQDEFSSQPQPTFWWRPDPSMGASVLTTFQLWKDPDGDTRYPLGVRDPLRYAQVTDPLNSTAYVEPFWQVPNAGIQLAEGRSGGRVRLYAGEALGADKYDVYYAPGGAWLVPGGILNWELRPEAFLRVSDVSLSPSPDPELVVIDLGPGTPNPGAVLRNGVEYMFALRARDAASNLDTLVLVKSSTSSRNAVPMPSSVLGAVTNLAVLDSNGGGRLTLGYTCSNSQNLRVYAADYLAWRGRPFDPRFIRATTSCAAGYNEYTLGGLVSRRYNLVSPVQYVVTLEPFDTANNVGTADTVFAVPGSSASLDTTYPPWANTGAIAATTAGQPPGQVLLTFDLVNDAAEVSTFVRRIYFGNYEVGSNESGQFIDVTDKSVTQMTFDNIPNEELWSFDIIALDVRGNAGFTKRASIKLPHASGSPRPTWATDSQALFFSVGYPTAGTVTHPLGVAYDYHGPVLDTSRAGEYVWRVVQDNGDPAQKMESKLGAFYTWSGFYYATTLAGRLNMANPSPNVHHRDVLNFVERRLSRASVMGAYFDSNATNGYRQRTTQGFLGMLEGGTNKANQLVLRYVADEDGVVTDVGLIPQGGGATTYGALLDVVAFDSQYVDRVSSSYPPHLQRKSFLTLYYGKDDQMIDLPGSAAGVSFNGSLADPDALDPEW